MSELDENDHLNEAGYLKYCLDAFHMSNQFNSKSKKVKSVQGKNSIIVNILFIGVFQHCIEEN